MKLITLIVAFLAVLSCNAQKNNITMAEKYDFELMKDKKTDTIISKGNTLIYITTMYESGAFYKEYPPIPEFYTIQKVFYPNGELKSKIKYIGERVLVGESIYFNEKGIITKVDEEKNWGKIKLDWILKFIEKEGFIDLKTGKGREEIEFDKSGVGYIKKGVFELGFSPKGEYSQEYSVWGVVIKEAPENNFYQTSYVIHGETGKVLEKTDKQVFRNE